MHIGALPGAHEVHVVCTAGPNLQGDHVQLCPVEWELGRSPQPGGGDGATTGLVGVLHEKYEFAAQVSF
jgi:hypothetical protein